MLLHHDGGNWEPSSSRKPARAERSIQWEPMRAGDLAEDEDAVDPCTEEQMKLLREECKE